MRTKEQIELARDDILKHQNEISNLEKRIIELEEKLGGYVLETIGSGDNQYRGLAPKIVIKVEKLAEHVGLEWKDPDDLYVGEWKPKEK
jgi:hypothetical protein